MARYLTIPIDADEAGLTWASAQFKDNDDVSVGAPILTGFRPSGTDYIWEGYAPDAFVEGHIVFNTDTAVEYEAAILASSFVVVSGDHKYVDQTYMELVRGVDNIRVWSRKGGSQSTTDEDAVDAAIERAESRADSTLRARYIMPLQAVGGGAMPVEDQITLRRLVEPIASFELYRARGLKDRDSTGKLLQAEYNEAIEQLEEFADLVNERILMSEQISVMNLAPTLVE